MILFRFLEDLSDVAYLPLLMLFALGIAVAFSRHQNKIILYFFLLLFLITASSRLFHLESSRYLLPLLVPIILISSFSFSLKQRYKRFLSISFLIIIFLFYAKKTFSIQEKKPYLWDIVEVLDRNHFFAADQFQYAYVLGNIGGHLSFRFDSTKTLQVLTSLKADNDESVNTLLSYIQHNDNPDKRALINKNIYLITTSDSSYHDFINRWKSFFYSSPRLIYSFTRKRNNRKYLVYQIKSDSVLSQNHPNQIIQLFKDNNILSNPQFVPSKITDSSAVKSFFSDREIFYDTSSPFFPAEWSFFQYSWDERSKPHSLVYEDNRFIFSSKGWIGLIQKNTLFKSGHTYFCLAAVDVFKESELAFLKEYLFAKNEKYFMGNAFFGITLSPGHHVFSFDVALSQSDREFVLNLILKRGSLSFDYLYFVDINAIDSFEVD